ncbi:MAG: LON peptidase substrate-binding domain-containing protein [Spongiibacter sp.]|nr:LON peptidase substrate-binding domain-containing protein [Spongiibacter sp.]
MSESVQQEYPLFPLGSVLFPGGRLALRIFERRYLDLIRDCMRQQSSFGIVLLAPGESEVDHPGQQAPQLSAMGCEARVVDWDQLPDGLLGITVEGGRRFQVLASHRADSGLHLGEVQWCEEVEDIPLPADCASMESLLRQLTSHPHVERLGLSAEVNGAGELVNRLAQLLPLPASDTYPLLAIDSPLDRLDALHDLLEQFES